MIVDTLEVLNSPSWMSYANCRDSDPDLFYPAENGRWSRQNVKQAMKICDECPVKLKCLQWAFDIGDVHGILGATMPEERRSILERKGRERRAA